MLATIVHGVATEAISRDSIAQVLIDLVADLGQIHVVRALVPPVAMVVPTIVVFVVIVSIVVLPVVVAAIGVTFVVVILLIGIIIVLLVIVLLVLTVVWLLLGHWCLRRRRCGLLDRRGWWNHRTF